MDSIKLYQDINSLPDALKKEVKDFVEFLLQKNKKNLKNQNKRSFGAMKNKIKLSKDFDSPIDDFKDYQ